MSCDRFRDAISARADGEDRSLTDDEIEEHLARCASCRSFDTATRRMRRQLAVYDAGTVPDVSHDVVKRTASADRRRTVPVIRWLLGVVAVLLVVQSVPEFLSDEAHSHSARHVGAFTLAYAVGLLVVVVRPARARTMLHVAIVLVGALAATTVIDVARGNVPLVDESAHVLELASAVFLWILTRPGRDRDGPGRPVGERRDELPKGLRVVDPHHASGPTHDETSDAEAPAERVSRRQPDSGRR